MLDNAVAVKAKFKPTTQAGTDTEVIRSPDFTQGTNTADALVFNMVTSSPLASGVTVQLFRINEEGMPYGYDLGAVLTDGSVTGTGIERNQSID